MWLLAQTASFLSTLSLRRATIQPGCQPPGKMYFYPRSPCGERHPHTSNHPHNTNFYPRSPCGERPVNLQPEAGKSQNFYPRSPCGERLPSVLHNFRPLQISIHALLAESDLIPPIKKQENALFLSTLSLRRATRAKSGQQRSRNNFYPRSPCGERLSALDNILKLFTFLSTLSLRRATFNPFETLIILTFLSTLSLRRATVSLCYMIHRH